MKRTSSTLFERICVATIPDSVQDEEFEKLTKKAKEYLSTFWPELVEEQVPLWKFRMSKPEENKRPEIQDATFKQSYALWSSPLLNNADNRTWRILIERRRIVFNYRKHTLTDPGTIKEFLDFILPVLGVFRKILGLSKWPSLALNYYFLYDSDSLHATPFFKTAVKNLNGGFFEVKKFLVPFSNFPDMNGFEFFIAPYQWHQRWKQIVDGIDYVSGLFIDTTTDSESKHIQLSMQLEVVINDKEENACDFEKMYNILKGNYSKLICQDAWKVLGGDCQ